jgi:hypothetical protein
MLPGCAMLHMLGFKIHLSHNDCMQLPSTAMPAGVGTTNLAHSGAKLSAAVGGYGVPDGRPQEIPSEAGAPYIESQANAMLLPGGQPNPYVKLILMTACANDVGYSGASCLANEEIVKRVNTCGVKLQSTLTKLGQDFPNATILVANYYNYANFKEEFSGLGYKVAQVVLSPLLLPITKLVAFLKFVGLDSACLITKGKVTLDDLDNVMLKNLLFVQSSTAAIEAATAAANRALLANSLISSSAKFVDVRFDPYQNAAWGRDPFIYDTGLLGLNDPLYDYRQPLCKMYTNDSVVSQLLCERASGFHPNHLGACRYAAAMLDILIQGGWCSDPLIASGINCKNLPSLPNCVVLGR